jgi:hypothetical protein
LSPPPDLTRGGYVEVKLNRVDAEFAEWIRSTLGDIVRVDPVPWGPAIVIDVETTDVA